MEQIQLGCAVFGEDWQFVVGIPHDARVAELQEAIGAKMLSRDDPIKPSMLKLYLARKNDAWVKRDRFSEPVDTAFEVMKPLLNVSDYLANAHGDNHEDGVAHVIVKRPPLRDAGRPAPIKLAVAVLAEDWQFVVRIPHDARVAELQEAIGAKMLSRDDPIKPSMLKLYLARKNDAWVKREELSKLAELSRDVVDPAFKVMDPMLKVSDYLVKVDPKNDKGGVVHVIVERPPAPVKLGCAVFGEDWQFVVRIPHDADVAELKEAIGAKMLSRDDPIKPSMLKLYLARKNDAWVKREELSKLAELSRDVVDPAFKVMDPMLKVSDYLVKVDPKNDKGGVVHVIVERPPAPVKLGCAVFGEDWQFVVRIPHDADVAELKEAIGAKMLSRDDPIKPSMLKLYLARKNDAWVKREELSKLAELSRDVVDPAFKVMDPMLKVSDYLVKVDPKNDKGGVAHVVVERPPAPVKLGCAVFGEDWQFVVRIPHDADVAELKEAIGAKMLSRDDPIKPSMLKLYLARKNDAWVKTEEFSLPAGLFGDVVDPAFKVMDPLVNVSDYLVKVDPKNDKGGVVHVIVKRPPPLRTDEEPPAKRQHVEQDVTLQDLWPRIEWKLDKLPPPKELQALLQKPLPFRLEDDPQAAQHGVFQSDAPRIECPVLQGRLGSFLRECRSLPDVESENSWKKVFDVLIQFTTDLLQANGVNVDYEEMPSASKHKRPGCFLHEEGIILMRGELHFTGVDTQASLQKLVGNMCLWNPLFYGNLPYILGFAVSKADLHVVAMEKIGQSFRKLPIFVFDVLRQPAEAIKLFFNVALLFHEMVRLVERPLPSELIPFLPCKNDERTVEMLDDRVMRTIKLSRRICGVDIERLHSVYTALKNPKSRGSKTTHLQTVETLRGKRNRELVVELSPIGYVRDPKLGEVGEWLRHLLMALKYWHGCGYCHGDVRGRKIIYVPCEESGYWVLIGMDKSRKSGTTKIDWDHPRQATILTFQHDLFQVGKLMEEFEYALPNHLKAMEALLLSGIGAQELTADKALATLLKLVQDS